MQRDALDVVCYNANLLRSFNQVIHFYNVRVVNLLQGHDFPLYSLSFHRVIQFGLLIDFNRKLPHVHFMVASIHNGICSLANGLSNLVVV